MASEEESLLFLFSQPESNPFHYCSQSVVSREEVVAVVVSGLRVKTKTRQNL